MYTVNVHPNIYFFNRAPYGFKDLKSPRIWPRLNKIPSFQPEGLFGDWSNIEECIWTPNGVDYYLAVPTLFGVESYLLNNETLIWEKTDIILPVLFFDQEALWTDGEKVYYKDEMSNQYYFNTSTKSWEVSPIYTGIDGMFYPDSVWTDGKEFYYSRYGTEHYKLNKSEKLWEPITWNGIDSFDNYNLWTDGTTVYCELGTKTYRVDTENHTFIDLGENLWRDEQGNLFDVVGGNIWTDGYEFYCSQSNVIYQLQKDTHVFQKTNINVHNKYSIARGLWANGKNLFYGVEVIPPENAKMYQKINNVWTEIPFSSGAQVESYDGTITIQRFPQ